MNAPLIALFAIGIFFEKNLFFDDKSSLNILKKINTTSINPNFDFVYSGGEPLNSIHIDEFINIAPNKTYLETNALLLSSDKIELINNSKIRDIRISLSSKDAYERTR